MVHGSSRNASRDETSTADPVDNITLFDGQCSHKEIIKPIWLEEAKYVDNQVTDSKNRMKEGNSCKK